MSGIAAAPRVVARFGRYRFEHDRSGWGFSDNATGVSGARTPVGAWWRWKLVVREQRRASRAWHGRKG